MPIHDWLRVDAGIFHAFHQQWLIAISNALNAGILPADYYALPEQFAVGFGPDVLTLQDAQNANETSDNDGAGSAIGLLVAEPKIEVTAETDWEFYRRKQTSIAVRHVGGDRIVAVIEIISPGNKSSRHAMRSFLEKTMEWFDRGIHLSVIDPFPPGPRDPQGIHAVIWDEIAGQSYALPIGKPLTIVAYQTIHKVRAYVQPSAVGENLPEMPLFLRANGCVGVPLEATYHHAFAAMPQRWRKVLA